MLTNALEVMRYVRASAGRSKLHVVFESVNQPRHDGDTIYLPKITKHTTQEQLEDMMCSTDHEVGHDRFSDFNIIKTAGIDMNSILGVMWNIIEDSRVNAIEAKEYYGFKQLWNKSAPSNITRIVESFKDKPDPNTKLMGSMLKWDSSVSEYLFPSIALAASGVNHEPKVDVVLDKYRTRLLETHSILDKTKGSKATLDLATEIFLALGGKIEEVTVSPTKGENGDGKGEGKGEEKETTTEASGGSKEDDGDEGKPSYEDEYKIVEAKLSSEAKKAMPDHDSRFKKVGTRHDSSTSRGGWTLTDFDKFVVVDYPNNIGPAGVLAHDYSAPGFEEEFKYVANKAQASEQFAQRVRRLIQIRAKSRREYGVKRGKLDQSRLSRVCFKDAAGFNERIFKRKITSDVLDAAVSVLIDMSGSMNGKKVLYATEAALLLNTLFSEALHIPLEICGFTDKHSGEPIQCVYKGFNNPHVSNEALLHYIACSSHLMNGNPDGENILWSYDRLKQQKAKKKLLIVLSDGQPAASKSESGIGYFTQAAVKQIEGEQIVDIYGLGILSDSVRSYYQHYSVVNTPESIPDSLIEVIERKLLNDHSY